MRSEHAPETVNIGCGAGFAGDRFDASLPIVETLAKRDGPSYLSFEVLAERTLALAQRQRMTDPDKGYSPFLDRYIEPVLAQAKAASIRIVSNMGAANPRGAARRILQIAASQGIQDLTVAVVDGDNLLEFMGESEIRSASTIEGIEIGDREILAANAYLGAFPVAQALATDADVVVTGRVTDPAIILGPLIYEFGWHEDDWDHLAAGTLAGHLLECGAQVTGAYFADPGFKDVPDLARVGFPIAEVKADGSMVITKADNTGGLVSEQTIKEQMLYEIHDPSAYLTADVTLDITEVSLEQIGKDRVTVCGARGHPRPQTLKATVSLDGGWLGEGEISYVGPNARQRAELAASVVRDRCRMIGIDLPVRLDIIGTVSTFDSDEGALRLAERFEDDGDYRVRAAVRTPDRETARMVSDEVLSLYCSGPAGGGGVRQALTQRVETASILVERERVVSGVHVADALAEKLDADTVTNAPN